MRDLIIVGAGGLGREVAFLIEAINDIELKWNLLGYFDEKYKSGSMINNYPILDRCYFLKKRVDNIGIVIAINNPSDKKKEFFNFQEHSNLFFPNLIAPNVVYGKDLVIGFGNIVTFNNALTVNIRIGNLNIFNIGCSVGHDSDIGDFNSFMPHVNVSGNIDIGNANTFGTNSSIKQNISIGNNCFVSMGSIVLESLKDNSIVSGNFATDHRQNLKEYQRKKMKG